MAGTGWLWPAAILSSLFVRPAASLAVFRYPLWEDEGDSTKKEFTAPLLRFPPTFQLRGSGARGCQGKDSPDAFVPQGPEGVQRAGISRRASRGKPVSPLKQSTELIVPLPPLLVVRRMVLVKRMADIDTETRLSLSMLVTMLVCRSSKLDERFL